MMQLTKKQTSQGHTYYKMQLLGNGGQVMLTESLQTPNVWLYSWEKGDGSVEANSPEEARTLVINKIVNL